MSTQQQPRPWFRLAGMMRPAVPAPAPQPPPPPAARPPAPPPSLQPPPLMSPFRPPVGLLRPPAPPPPVAATAPQSPVAPPPAPLSVSITSPSSATPTTPRSPQITSTTGAPSPITASAVSSPTPKSTTAINGNGAGVVVPPPVAPPKPESPIIKKLSSSPPASPGQKASAETSATRPVVYSSSLPPSPKTKVASAPPSPIPPAPKTLISSQSPNAAAPAPAPVLNNTIGLTADRAASPVPPPPSPVTNVRAHYVASNSSPKSSPKTAVKPPHESPILKHLSHPPSPLTLPPPQLKAADTNSHDYLEPIPQEPQQKTVLLQDTSHHNHEIPKTTTLKPTSRSSTGVLVQSNHNGGEKERQLKKDKGKHKNSTDASAAAPELNGSGMRVVTLAGQNHGAVMELSPAAASRGKIKKYGFGQNIWSNGQKLESDKEDEGRNHDQTNSYKNDKMKAQTPLESFVNSNVQVVNNSILYNCTYSNRDPGVHLSVSRKGNGFPGLHLQQQDTGHHD